MCFFSTNQITWNCHFTQAHVLHIHYYCSLKKIHQMSATLIWNLCNSQSIICDYDVQRHLVAKTDPEPNFVELTGLKHATIEMQDKESSPCTNQTSYLFSKASRVTFLIQFFSQASQTQQKSITFCLPTQLFRLYVIAHVLFRLTHNRTLVFFPHQW